VERPDLIESGLRQNAWDQAGIDDFVQKYIELKNSALPEETIAQRIRQMLGWRKKVVERESEDEIKVPLYSFGAPNVEDAAVQYSEGESFTKGSGWALKVFGIGTGDTTTVEVTKSRTFVAGAGTWKQVFVPVKLIVSHIAIYERDRLVGHGIDAQVAPPPTGKKKDQYLKRRGCKDIKRSALGARPEECDDTLELDLEGDTSGALHKEVRSWETNVAHEVSIALEKVANVSALVNVKRTRRLELEFALPSGHDYLAYLTPGKLWWERPRSD
jgi:hypothetical protein